MCISQKGNTALELAIKLRQTLFRLNELDTTKLQVIEKADVHRVVDIKSERTQLVTTAVKVLIDDTWQSGVITRYRGNSLVDVTMDRGESAMAQLMIEKGFFRNIDNKKVNDFSFFQLNRALFFCFSVDIHLYIVLISSTICSISILI